MANNPEENFPKDVADHTMEVRLDSGIHRDLHFSNRGSSINAFSLTTWTGHLAISGDMGTFVFSRLPDMFRFFRGDRINAHYWMEKLEAVDRSTGDAMQFSPDKFLTRLREMVEENFEDEPARRAEILEDMKDVCTDGDDESSIRRAWNDFKSGDFSFTDLWEVRGRVYTYRFIWACHAIVWGIAQYDATKAAVTQNSAEVIQKDRAQSPTQEPQ